jgi:hypothetical protein
MNHRLTLVSLPGTFAVCGLEPDSPVPAWASAGAFSSVTRTAAELSVVGPDAAVPEGVRCDRGWHAWRLGGTFDLTTAVGILASVVDPLAAAGVGVFAVSTFDTDYLLVKANNVERAAAALRARGHTVN